ncbi:hypothetical protein BS78_01G120800, partial [Paspalum vaginatum]
MAAVLDAFASKLSDILVGMAKDEVEMLLGVPGEITKLETTLGDLSSILGDAERSSPHLNFFPGSATGRIHDSAVERWVRELKDIMIMEGGEDPSSSAAPKTNSGCWSMPKMFYCFRNPVAAHEIGTRIQALNKRLEDLEKRSSRFGFITQAINSASDKASDSLSDKTGSIILQSDVVGNKIVEDTKKIVDQLIKKGDTPPPIGTKGSNVVVAVAITGMGGIGKTTLARMVFNDSMVDENFDKKIWLSVNQKVNEISVLQSVLASFGGYHEGLAGSKDLIERALTGTVQQKKFLLVVDDMWSEDVWNELLRVPLSHGASGSRVLVTTRNDEVAHGMRAHHLHRVDKLGIEDAWILLKDQVVLDGSDEANVDRLKGVGMKIVERCEGLPLAVKDLGGVLRRRSRTTDAWMDVSSHYTWSTSAISKDINKAVYLSYEDLPSHLKQCFVYCSLFPKHELMGSYVIVRLWMAEGYICKKMSSKSPEDLGIEYYRELISRNLLEVDKDYYDQSGFSMHDVVRSCAQNIMKDEGLLLSEGQDVNRTLGTAKLRHLSISNKAPWLDILQKQASLRALILFGSTTLELNKDLLSNLSFLRVLYLYNVNLVEPPESISQLKHLRCLVLAGTSISTVPRGIGYLRFLQTIDLPGCTNISRLPDDILKLRRLRSLDLRGTGITSVPRGFRKLEDLVNMVGFRTHSEHSVEGWCSLEELGPLSKLKILEVDHLEKAPSDNITEEEHGRIEEVLANLCPPTCIECLDIKGYFARGIPQWMRTMSAFGSLRRLALEDYACCLQLPNGLGQLPFLDYFWVYRAPSVEHVGHQLLGRSSLGADVAFPKLKELGFEVMLGWTEWEWEKQVPAMPVLEELRVEGCKLQRLPAGLAHHACRLRELHLICIMHLVSVDNFPSLEKLWLYDNPSVERISNNPSLQWIDIANCPALKELDGLPSLRSLEWWDLEAEALPQYLRVVKLNKLRVDCSPALLKLIALRDDSSEWEKIQHIQQVEVYGKKLTGDDVDMHIFYTKEPHSFDVHLGEST